ncbi:virulence protein [Proteus mirabilis]|nr:helix-turn-helix domain-containing protein [Proteus mirabilis]EJD6393017.1 helix-turn-helix domain-containing protein [Proteus mirabilis]EKW1742049.1 helix-turn-helix domain-containing protein [Proteus mirabilis]KSW21906.1 virulence protein [Proteus mirabilis]MBI6276678.1 helix-turn-helix domain-containing protein [Proteus mirabilis]
MKRLQAFKFQLRPNGQQEREMRRFAGACRFVFNRALARQNENYEAGTRRSDSDISLNAVGIHVL